MADSRPEIASVVVDTGLSLVGQNLRGFVVEALIGQGGMGEVYRARHESLPKTAAVKVLKVDVAADEEWKRRFVREAEAVSSLKHPSIVQLYNFGTLGDGRQYLVMEFIDGQPLDALLFQRGALSPHETLVIAEQILDGLTEAHRAGVVHRDLKPANVILEKTSSAEPRVKLVDFGLARQALAHDAKPTLPPDALVGSEKSSLLAGTPHYVSPEQAQGEVVDGRADVYSLGLMLYEMLSGKLPFDDESVARLLERQIGETPVPLREVATFLSKDLSDFVDSLLAKSPTSRPSAESARNQVRRLRRALAESGTLVTSVGGQVPQASTGRLPGRAAEPTLQLRRKAPRRAWLAAVPLLALLLVGGWWGLRAPASTPPREVPPTALQPVAPPAVEEPTLQPPPPVKHVAAPDHDSAPGTGAAPHSRGSTSPALNGSPLIPSPSPLIPSPSRDPDATELRPPGAPPLDGLGVKGAPSLERSLTAEKVVTVSDGDVRKCNGDLTAYSKLLETKLRGKLNGEARDRDIDRALRPLRKLQQQVEANSTLEGCQALDAKLDAFGTGEGL